MERIKALVGQLLAVVYQLATDRQQWQGFFSKFLMGARLKIFCPRQPPTGTKSDGGTCEKYLTDAKPAHLIQN